MAAGKEIKRLRDGQITAAKLAGIIGVGVDKLRKWEERDTDPNDTGDIQKVEAYFGCKLKDLGSLKKFDFVQFSRGKEKSPGELDPSKSLLHAIVTLTESNKGLVDSNKTVVETNQVIADTNRVLAMKLINDPTGGAHEDIPSDELATIVALRGLVIEMYADLKKTTLEEAEAVLGIKAVAAKKTVRKKDIPSGASR